MSLPYILIRSAHLNKNTLQLTSLFNLFNIQATETVKATARKAKILGEFGQSDISVNDSPVFFGHKSKYMIAKFGKEPYLDLRCWIIFDHLNKTIQDLSLYANEPIYETGYPCLTIGEDSGLYGRNLATILNRTETILEYYRIPHNASIDFAHADFSTGWTIMLIFKPYRFKHWEDDLVDHTIYQKMNDTTATGGVSIRIGEDGRLKVFVRIASADLDFISEKFKLRMLAYNTAVITYDPLANPRIRVRINGEVMVYENIDETPEWSEDPANRDAYFGLGNNQNSGKAWMAIQEFRLYKGAMTDTQCKNLFQNKLTVESYQYGESTWLGYCRFPDASGVVGFDSTTFDSTTYDTS